MGSKRNPKAIQSDYSKTLSVLNGNIIMIEIEIEINLYEF